MKETIFRYFLLVTRTELSVLRRIIEKDDYSAFMTISDVSEIVGKHIKSTEHTIRKKEGKQ